MKDDTKRGCTGDKEPIEEDVSFVFDVEVGVVEDDDEEDVEEGVARNTPLPPVGDVESAS